MNQTLMDLKGAQGNTAGQDYAAIGDQTGKKRPRKGPGKAIFWFIVILLLFGGGISFYYFSSQNNASYYVLKEGQMIVVKRGIFFPTGSRLYNDHAAFAPIMVPDSMKLDPIKVDSARQVDRLLFNMLNEQISIALKERTSQSLDRAKEYVRRARLLDVPEHEFDKLMQVRGDIALGEAQSTLSSIAPLLRSALIQMQGAAHLEMTEYGDPRMWIEWTRERLEEFESIEKNKASIGNDLKFKVCSAIIAQRDVEPEAEEPGATENGAQQEGGTITGAVGGAEEAATGDSDQKTGTGAKSGTGTDTGAGTGTGTGTSL